VEHEAEMLAQYRVAFETDGHSPRAVYEPRFFATAHRSSQPFLVPLEETAWCPACRLAPYRLRRRSAGTEMQGTLFESEREASMG
jgi:hypothetical protein